MFWIDKQEQQFLGIKKKKNQGTDIEQNCFFIQTAFCGKEKLATGATSEQPDRHEIQKYISGENMYPKHSWTVEVQMSFFFHSRKGEKVSYKNIFFPVSGKAVLINKHHGMNLCPGSIC